MNQSHSHRHVIFMLVILVLGSLAVASMPGLAFADGGGADPPMNPPSPPEDSSRYIAPDLLENSGSKEVSQELSFLDLTLLVLQTMI